MKVKTKKKKVGDLSTNTMYNVSGSTLPPIKTDRHYITRKVVIWRKITKNKQIQNTKKTKNKQTCAIADFECDT
jgi:hypothetical protein